MKRLLAAAGLLAGAAAVAVIPAVQASAAVQPHQAGPSASTGTTMVLTADAHNSGASPDYEQSLSSSIKCASWKGDLSWGGNGSILDPAYIDLSSSVLKDNCSSGYAQLFIHWDTIDNPKNELVKKIGPNTSANAPFSTDDHFNTYKDIYVYICSEGGGGYRCGNKKGPGA